LPFADTLNLAFTVRGIPLAAPNGGASLALGSFPVTTCWIRVELIALFPLTASLAGLHLSNLGSR